MRIYENKYISVTSLISLKEPFNKKAYESWCEANGLCASLIASNSSVMGEKVGRWLEDGYHGLQSFSEPPMDKLEERLKQAVDGFLKNWTILECELEVTCEELNYAGRVDAIVEEKKTKEQLLVDFKTYGAWKDKPYKRDTKKIKHARWQTTLYANALGWEDGIGVVIIKNDGEFEVEKLKFDQKILDWAEENQELILKTIEDEKWAKQFLKEYGYEIQSIQE